jgi:predicted NUDIX family phosphoesterase
MIQLMTNEPSAREEHVLCIKRSLYEAHEPFHGFRHLEGRSDLGDYLQGAPDQPAFFMPRSTAEHDASLKQLLPYIAILQDDDILVYERSITGSEKRLHGQLSIGIGGHINDDDDPDSAWLAFLNGTMRELKEEVGLEVPHQALQGAAFGLINDETHPVGEVHLGVCMAMHIAEGRRDTVLKHAEHTILRPRFVPLLAFENPELFGQLETWSQHLVMHLIAESCKNGKWNDPAFRERVGMMAVCAANLASASAGFLLQESPGGHMISRAQVEAGVGECMVLMSGLIGNEDIGKEAVIEAEKAFHAKLPDVLVHQPVHIREAS